MNATLISLVVPCYNEASSIEAFVTCISKVFTKIPDVEYEIVFVDDGSHDDTLQNILEYSDQIPHFQLVEFSRNFGKEAALTAGLNAARGNAIIPIDVDLQDPPELIYDMIKEWEKGAEVVLAKRSNRSTDTFIKRCTANCFYKLCSIILDTKIPDNVGDFRLMDRVVIEALKTLPEKQRFMKGLFSWVGFRTVTINYIRQPRNSGKTKFSFFSLWNFALEGITSFSTAPLKYGHISAYAGHYYP